MPKTKKATASTAKPKSTLRPPRRRKTPEYKRFRYSKRIKHPGPKLSSSWRLFWRSFKPFRQHWKLFGGIVLIYGILTLIFVRGFGSSTNITELKGALDGVFGGTGGQLSTGVTLFGVLLSSTGAGNQTAGLYQTMLLVVFSLSLIWGLRRVASGQQARVTIRDTFYRGMFPLVPFLLVLLVIAVQLIPMLIGSTLYSLVVGNGLAVGGLEQFAWAAAFFLLALWSLYMITPSVMALFVVTLPNMTPLKALRSARKLVRYRRWTVLRKLVILPVILLVVLAVIMLPLILWATPVAEWSFFIIGLFVTPVVISYGYGLYRELL